MSENLHITDLDRRRLELLADSVDRNEHMEPYASMLREVIGIANAIPSASVPADVVTMNSRVRYEDRTTRTIREVQLVYPEDADAANGKVSVLSPLGNALLGLRVGQGALLRLPYGEARRVKVLGILYQPEAAGHLTT
jgi:regulator of nucleoside diphosphate kinase